jgi:hypothetical protein
MVERKDNPSNVELLKIAKDLVYSEYATKKNDIHEKWVVESLYLWQTQQVRLAYPELPPYPTDKDIVDRAKRLVEFINTPRPDLGEGENTNINNITINNSNVQETKEKPSEGKPKEGLFDKFVKIFTIFTKKSITS